MIVLLGCFDAGAIAFGFFHVDQAAHGACHLIHSCVALASLGDVVRAQVSELIRNVNTVENVARRSTSGKSKSFAGVLRPNLLGIIDGNFVDPVVGAYSCETTHKVLSKLVEGRSVTAIRTADEFLGGLVNRNVALREYSFELRRGNFVAQIVFKILRNAILVGVAGRVGDKLSFLGGSAMELDIRCGHGGNRLCGGFVLDSGKLLNLVEGGTSVGVLHYVAVKLDIFTCNLEILTNLAKRDLHS